MNKFFIDVDGPFDFGHTIRYWNRISGEIVDRIEEGSYKRVLRAYKKIIFVSIRPLSQTSDPKLEVTYYNFSPLVVKKIEQKLHRIFNLDLNLSGFYELATEDELLSAAIKKLYGYRPPCFPTLFESLVCTVIGQQINVSFALDVKSRLVRRFGKSVLIDGRKYFAFPNPESMASSSVKELRKLRVSRQKARYIIGIAKLFAEGKVDEEELRKSDDEEVLRYLMEIKGIGRWSAEYIMIRGLGRTSIIPAAGTGIRAAFSHFFGMKKVTEEDVRRLSERWGNYKGLAGFYLRSAYYSHILT